MICQYQFTKYIPSLHIMFGGFNHPKTRKTDIVISTSTKHSFFCMVEISDKCAKPPISDSTAKMALVKFKNKQWDLQ